MELLTGLIGFAVFMAAFAMLLPGMRRRTAAQGLPARQFRLQVALVAAWVALVSVAMATASGVLLIATLPVGLVVFVAAMYWTGRSGERGIP
jgi:hypothetical protein